MSIYEVEFNGLPDGSVERLGLGHAWVWTRANGNREIFDCGLSISLVLEYMPKRIGCNPRDINIRPAVPMKSPLVEGASYIRDAGNYTELMVLRSGGGWYVGTLYNNPGGYQEPGSRDSDYFTSDKDAQGYLDAINQNPSVAAAGLMTRMKP